MSSLASYVGTLNALGDESRLRLCALLRGRELSVSDLVKVTGLPQSRVSTHLARLKEGGFVRDRREGAHAFYGLAELSGAARAMLDEATSARDPLLEGDQKRLAELEHGRFPEEYAGEMERHYSPGRTWQSLAKGIAALLRLGDVLDVGSGDGAAAAYLAPYARSLTCVDASEKMIAAAKKRFAKSGNVEAVVADAHELPFAARSFDDVLLFHTLAYAERPAVVLAECTRVLRPGGRVVVLSLDAHAQRDLTAAYGERHPGFRPRDLRRLLADAGLEVDSCEVACREAKKPYFEVVLATASKRPSTRKI